MKEYSPLKQNGIRIKVPTARELAKRLKDTLLPPTNEGRRDVLKKIGIGTLGGAIASTPLGYIAAKGVPERNIMSSESEQPLGNKPEEIVWEKYKKLKSFPENFERHQEIVPMPTIEGLETLSAVTEYGAGSLEDKVINALKYQNISRIVEEKYNLEPNVLLAIAIVESTAMPLLANHRGDGGFGLCHMQGRTASEFGLHTFGDCNETVCSRGHAAELVEIIQKEKYDLRKLVQYDDRLNPVMNLDAAGRMLAAYKTISPNSRYIPASNIEMADLDTLERAIALYCGPKNFRNYYPQVKRYMKILNDYSSVADIKRKLTAKNKNLRINGESASIDDYIQVMQEQNINYGLNDYDNTVSYTPGPIEKAKRKHDSRNSSAD